MKYNKVHENTSAEIKILYQLYNVRGKELTKRFPHMSRANIYKHAHKAIGTEFIDRRKENKGRPSGITEPLRRRIKREVEILTANGEGFTSKDIQNNVGATSCVCNRTIRREMNRTGIKYLHLRKKGVLLRGDLTIRLKFAQKCRRLLQPNFWTHGVSMYLDGVGFEYKTNPCKSVPGTRTMGWRRKNLGLDLNQTAKGKKEGKKCTLLCRNIIWKGCCHVQTVHRSNGC